jgi:D-alanyl-lipoteichoic acid acyltransferase DltB (MBOAT superfamily)
MLLALLIALALAPLYWLLVPIAWRRDLLTLASLMGLGAYDWRLPVLLLTVSAGVWLLVRLATQRPERRRTATAVGVAALLALFAFNKLAGSGPSALATQSGLVFLGVSFLVLKAAGALIDAARGALPSAPFANTLAWLAFLPTYPSGPMETYQHFGGQQPIWDRVRVFAGLERILTGLVKALLGAHYLGVWIDPLLVAPEQHRPLELLAGVYAGALRFYFDLAGYSDIAIGLAAVVGYDIAENFDYPFAARNLVLLWQRWHITLTGWLRTYVFTPLTRALMRRRLVGDRMAIAAGSFATMLLIGLWHGVSWNFVVFGLLHGVGVTWVSLFARNAGRRLLPPALPRWWRQSRAGYACSVAVTVSFFAATALLVGTDLPGAVRYAQALLGGE